MWWAAAAAVSWYTMLLIHPISHHSSDGPVRVPGPPNMHMSPVLSTLAMMLGAIL